VVSTQPRVSLFFFVFLFFFCLFLFFPFYFFLPAVTIRFSLMDPSREFVARVTGACRMEDQRSPDQDSARQC